jgi:pyruvate/2-oxoglutarate/acetoin dehydrogenase E1 component|tara:strand:- start:21498 stop:22019 length:522 start_codon:yes stop_codon:yes gene_type:complete
MDIKEELKKAMEWLAEQPDAIFVGQNIVYPENQMYRNLIDIPDDKKFEMPVAEEMQMGVSIGLALEGYIPVSIYPRFDFLILATNQIVNHLDKLRYLYRDNDSAKVIIRTAVGGTKPLDAGPQHTKNHTEAFRLMCPSINVVEITKPEEILPTYQEAYSATDSYIIVENWNGN